MAKGMYSFLAYPESADISKICDGITEMGGDWQYILHDKDTWSSKDEAKNPEHKAGTLKKPHWHIHAGFERGFPDWKKFVAFMKSVNAIAPGNGKLYDYSTAFVRNPAAADAYLTHELCEDDE